MTPGVEEWMDRLNLAVGIIQGMLNNKHLISANKLASSHCQEVGMMDEVGRHTSMR